MLINSPIEPFCVINIKTVYALTFELIVTFYPISNGIYICLSNVDIKEDRAKINLVQLLQMLYINICMAVNTFDVDVCQQQVFSPMDGRE